MPSPAARFELVPTPVPTELAFRVHLHAPAYDDTMIPAVGETYTACRLPDKPRVMDGTFGSYVFVAMGNSQYENHIAFLFCKAKTEQEKNTPFRTTTRYGNHSWPPILRALGFIPDASFPRSTNVAGPNGQQGIVTGPSYYVRDVYVPGAREGSKFVIEEYFAPTQYTIPQHEAPQPSAVSYDIGGRSGTFPECLHPKIIIPTTRTGTEKVVGESSGEVSGALAGQIFPATNFTSWEPYVIADDQDFNNGWHRIKAVVYPPDEPVTTFNQ